MFELPSFAIDDAERVCDWVELCCIADEGLVSRSDVAGVLHKSGLFDEPSPPAHSPQDAIDHFSEFAWSLLRRRARDLGSSYPVQVDADIAVRAAGSWQASVAYVALLIADIGRYYDNVSVAFEPGGPFPRLFEKIVQASHRGLFRGPTSRFGIPREPDWPTPVYERLDQLAAEMEVITETLDEKVDATDGDLGLDIAARMTIAGGHRGTLVLLTQCATGKNWADKTGEPSLELWMKLLDWRAKIVRAIALPWRDPDHTRTYLRFDAMVLDRPRLCAGSPDSFLDPVVRDPLVEWCARRLAEFPRLQ